MTRVTIGHKTPWSGRMVVVGSGTQGKLSEEKVSRASARVYFESARHSKNNLVASPERPRDPGRHPPEGT